MSEAKRDRWGRYLLPPASGGEPVAHIRATTIAETLDDRFFLEKWQQRMVAHGLSKRDDLQALAAATPLSDRKQLNKVCEQAIEAAGGGDRANKGTAVHSFTERVDRGEDVEIPPPWNADVAAYRACLAEHRMSTDPNFIECIAVCDGLAEPVAGTFDRIIQWGDELFIGDLKTGGKLDFSWRKIAVQLGIYSRAKTIWDREGEQHHPMPPVSQEAGIIFHLPVGEAKCTAYLVDIAEGWRAAQASLWVRGWRKRDDLHSPVGVPQQEQLAA